MPFFEINVPFKDIVSKVLYISEFSNETPVLGVLKSKLNPQKISLNDKILKYTAHIQATEKLEFINNTLSSMDGDLNNLDETIKTTTLYKPKSLFESHFVNDIARNYMDILKDVNFKPLDSVSFDLKTFDIVVNNEAKKEHGKGYRALLNSVLILSLRKYINDNAHINPKFYLIDSPLHGLAMPHNAEDTENVRKGFFNYLINNYNDDQMIIIENILPDELPNNIKDDPKIKLIAFTQDENSGIYGLLNNVTKK